MLRHSLCLCRKGFTRGIPGQPYCEMAASLGHDDKRSRNWLKLPMTPVFAYNCKRQRCNSRSGTTGTTQESLPQQRKRKEERKKRQEQQLVPLQSLFWLQLQSLLLCFTILLCHPDTYPLLTHLFALQNLLLRKRFQQKENNRRLEIEQQETLRNGNRRRSMNSARPWQGSCSLKAVRPEWGELRLLCPLQ